MTMPLGVEPDSKAVMTHSIKALDLDAQVTLL
jgi:hypothetical protein